MRENYSILTFSDVPLPSYDRPYRGVLFVDYAPADFIHEVFVISPASTEQFQHHNTKVKRFYFNAPNFKKIQYNIFYRLFINVKLFLNLIKWRIGRHRLDFIRTGSTYLSLLVAITQRKDVPYIADCCDFYSDLYREFNMPFPRLICPIIHRLERYALQRADLIFVDTHAQRKYISNIMSISSKKVAVVPNGVLIDNFPYPVKKDSQLMCHYGFGDNDIILFYGGDISKMDGIEMLIDFVDAYRYSLPIKLLILGKGNAEYINSLKNRINKLSLKDQIIFDGFKPYSELYRYISLSDVCLAPFRLTNTSNVVECGKIITYMLCGKMVLSTKADGVMSLYKDMIKYFIDGDYTDFSQQLIAIINNLPDKLQSNNIRLYAEMFDFQKIIDHEIKVIRDWFGSHKSNNSNYDYLP